MSPPFKNLTTQLGFGCGCSSTANSNYGETCTPTTSIFSSGSSVWHNCNEIIEKKTTTNASASRRWKTGDDKTNTNSISTTALVMESENPYEDFQESMLEMIMENQIFCAEELVQLLHAFLRLNSPTHHHLILCAFFQVYQYAIVSSLNENPRPNSLK